MTKNIEVEVRGILTKKDYDQLNKKLLKDGKFISHKDRVLIDYSTFIKKQGIKNRTKDIRLRVTNKIPEIIIKLGKWGGNDQREELSVLTKKGSFDTLVKAFNILGYSKGMLCVRDIKAYKYKGAEFAVVSIPGHGYFYEAEKIVSNSKKEKEQASLKLEKICSELNLEILSDKDHCDYVEKLNKEINEVFDFKNYTDDYFKNRFNL
jgi:adenylate cyclase class IV